MWQQLKSHSWLANQSTCWLSVSTPARQAEPRKDRQARQRDQQADFASWAGAADREEHQVLQSSVTLGLGGTQGGSTASTQSVPEIRQREQRCIVSFLSPLSSNFTFTHLSVC